MEYHHMQTPPAGGYNGGSGCAACRRSVDTGEMQIRDGWGYPPGAYAVIRGGPLAPGIQGIVTFSAAAGGTWVCVHITGLPPYRPGDAEMQPMGPFGFHIHENGDCAVNDPRNPFAATGSHWNPDGQPHGNHAGDFPVLFSNHGLAMTCFFTDRFQPGGVAGRSIVIHMHPDDYRTPPAGDSGSRLACGVIQAV